MMTWIDEMLAKHKNQQSFRNRTQEENLDLSRILRQPVKSQNSANGELTHELVATKVHKGDEIGGGAAAGWRRVDSGGSAGI